MECGQPAMIMVNHAGMFDVPLLSGFIFCFFIGIAAYHQFNWPVYGWMLECLRHIPVVRENP